MTPALDLLVFGAHLAGEPLNHQLTDAGATLLGEAATAPEYRMHLLGTVPPKPGVVRVGPGGACLPGELWSVPAAGIGALASVLEEPLTLGRVRLPDGRSVLGFLCEAYAVTGRPQLDPAGGWRGYRRGLAPTEPVATELVATEPLDR
jgi:allophanate hydrolase